MDIKTIVSTIFLAVGILISVVLCVTGIRKSWPHIKRFGHEVKEEANKVREAAQTVILTEDTVKE